MTDSKFSVQVWSLACRAWLCEGTCATREIALRFVADERAIGKRARVKEIK
jgi:hypothetical protein